MTMRYNPAFAGTMLILRAVRLIACGLAVVGGAGVAKGDPRPAFIMQLPNGQGQVMCAVAWPDENKDGQLSPNELLAYAELCQLAAQDHIANVGAASQLWYSSDSQEVAANKAVAVMDAAQFIMYHPPTNDSGAGTGQPQIDCNGAVAGNTCSCLPPFSPGFGPLLPTDLQPPQGPPGGGCLRAVGTASLLVQAVSGLPSAGEVSPGFGPPIAVPQPLKDPRDFAPSCNGPFNPNIPPTIPNPSPTYGPNNPDPNVPRCDYSPSINTGNGGSSGDPGPSKGPIHCAGMAASGGGNPCAVPEDPGDYKPEPQPAGDIWACAGNDCDPPVDPPPPSQAPPVWCAGLASNCAMPDCNDVPCDDGPVDVGPREFPCAGNKCEPPIPGRPEFPPGMPNPTRGDPTALPKPKDLPMCGGLEPHEVAAESGTGAPQPNGQGSAAGEGATSCDPVDLVHGYKIEEETDLIVPLTGRPFTLTRQYSTNPHDLNGPSIFGNGWTSPLFRQLVIPRTNSVITSMHLLGGRANSYIRLTKIGMVWKPNGASREELVEDPINKVIRMYVPGEGTAEFSDDPSDPLLRGRIVRQYDEYGNTWTFAYRKYLDSNQVAQAAALDRIFLNGTESEDSKAVVTFEYYTALGDGADEHPLVGKVARVRVWRPDSSAPEGMLEIHRVEYSYKHPRDPFPTDVGTNGDLIQVVKFSRVDSTPSSSYVESMGPGYPHRSSVVQYRYHTQENETTPTLFSVTGDLSLGGMDHQLKAVFRPAQLEYYAERLFRDIDGRAGKDFAVRDAAYRLMMLPDASLALNRFGETFNVLDMASKIVGYEGSTGRVSHQLLQAGCGCAGAGQMVRMDYVRHQGPVTNPPTPPTWRSTSIVEKIPTGTNPTTWTVHTTRHVDSEKLAGSDAFYTVNDVLVSNESPSRTWITHYEYDSARRLSQVWPPAACTERTYAAAVSNTPPSLGAPLSWPTERVTYYKYNDANNRLSETGVLGTSDTDFVKLTEIEYFGIGSGIHGHLPTKVTRFATTGGSPVKEQVEFEYTFSGDPAYPNEIAELVTKTQRETAEQNGPDDDEVVATTTLIDTNGQTLSVTLADGHKTAYTYDALTGQPTSWTEQPGAVSPLEPIVYRASYDLAGRIRRSDVPAPNDGRAIRQWRYEYAPIGTGAGDVDLDERTGLAYPVYMSLPEALSSTDTQGGVYVADRAEVTWTDASERPLTSRAYRVSSIPTDTGVYVPANEREATEFRDWFSHSNEVARVRRDWTLSGLLGEQTQWDDLQTFAHIQDRPADLRTQKWKYEYDALGRMTRLDSSDGESRVQVYDTLGRVVRAYRGVTSDPALAQLDDSLLVSEYGYDAQVQSGTIVQGVGNGLLTVVREFTGEAAPNDKRDTRYVFDPRDRLSRVINPLPPHQEFEYDNLGRVTRSRTMTAESNGTPVTDVRTSYSRRGLVYKTAVAIDPNDLGDGFLESHVWYDDVGRVKAAWGPDSPATKIVYDSFGRVQTRYVTDRRDDAAPGATGNFEDAVSVDDDVVLSQTHYQYSTFGAIELVTTLARVHDALVTPGTYGPLSTSGTGALGVTTYLGYDYDSVGRVKAVVDFGTNNRPNASERLADSFSNGTAPVWPLSGGATLSGDELVTRYVYDVRGDLAAVIDPEKRVGQFVRDAMGRTIASIENAQVTANYEHVPAATLSWSDTLKRWTVTSGYNASSPDHNRVTSTSYLTTNGAWRIRQTAHDPRRDPQTGAFRDQTTESVFGVTRATSPQAGDSLITSNLFVRETRFPDEITGEPSSDPSHRILYAYNRLGEPRGVTDQNGTAHHYTRDALGRVVFDQAYPTAAFTIDQRVNGVSSQFDPANGLLTDVKSWNANQVVDHVQYRYTPLLQLAKVIQDPDSEIGVNVGRPSREVGYGYINSPITANNTARVGALIYPADGNRQTSLAFNYGVTNAWDEVVDNRISRVSGLTVEDAIGGVNSANPIAEYFYLGLGTLAQVDFAQIGMQLDRTIDEVGNRRYGQFSAGGGSPTQAAGVYPGFDRFGRVKRHAWVRAQYDNPNASTTPPLPPTAAQQEVWNTHYAYDKASNPILRKNDRRGVGLGGVWRDRDWTFHYDGLNRLTKAEVGVASSLHGGSRTGPMALTMESVAPGSRKWVLDALGNWQRQAISLTSATGSGMTPATATFVSSEYQSRAHNLANEIQDAAPELPGSIPAGSPLSLSFQHRDPSKPTNPESGYDHNGNRLFSSWRLPAGGGLDGFDFEYVYDAWNRLTEIRRVRVLGGVRQTGGAGGGGGGGTYNTYGAIARYTYNGLSWRTSKTTCGPVELSDAATTPPVLRERRIFTYNASWQLIVEEVDDDLASSTWPGATPVGGGEPDPNDPDAGGGVDRVVQQFFGIRGLNDAIYRREDRPVYTPYSVDPVTEVETPESLTPRKGGGVNDAPGVGYAQAWYQLSDPQLSVVSVVAVHDAVTNAVGSVIDELEYDPYGNVRRTPGYGCLNASTNDAGGGSGIDVDRSGVVDVADLNNGVLEGFFSASPAADFNQDGETGVVDLFLGMDTWFVVNGTPGGGAYQRSRLSASYVPGVKNGSGVITSYGTVHLGESSSDNPYGYCGYYFDVETAAAKVLGPDARDSAYGGMFDWGGALYSVRHRVYDPQQGRWLTRDPAGFVDGMNLYEYCGGRATSCFDPMGLKGCRDSPAWHHMLPGGEGGRLHTLFKSLGIDVDAAEFGLIFEDAIDHMDGSTHSKWNNLWETWYDQQLEAKSKDPHYTITKDAVIKQLNRMKLMKQFSSWFAKGTIAKHSYGDWRKLSVRQRLSALRWGRDQVRKMWKHLSSPNLLGRIGREIPVANFLFLVNDIRNGKSVVEAMIDNLIPIPLSVDEMKEVQQIIEQHINSYIEEGQENAWRQNQRRRYAPGNQDSPKPLTPGQPG